MTYRYHCPDCGHTFEVQHGVHEAGPASCPQCKKRKVRKQITAPAIHLRYSPMHPRANRGRGY